MLCCYRASSMEDFEIHAATEDQKLYSRLLSVIVLSVFGLGNVILSPEVNQIFPPNDRREVVVFLLGGGNAVFCGK